MKVLFDTNIFIRFATNDLPKQAKVCKKLFDLVDEGKIKPYVSFITFFEINYLLTKTYSFSKIKTLDFIESILELRNVTVLKKADVSKLILLYKIENVGLADALIVGEVGTHMTLCTYDEKLLKIVKNALTPEKLLNKLERK